MINDLPKVKDEVEVQILNHTFCFRRLKWTEMSLVNEWMITHKMQERLAVSALSLYKISGVPVTPEEALKVLLTMPRTALDMVYKYFKGSLDPHRMFNSTPLYIAPDIATFNRKLFEEGDESEKTADELEEYLNSKFGRKEVQEEMEMGRRIVEGTGLAGAITKEREYLSSVQQKLNEDESW